MDNVIIAHEMLHSLKSRRRWANSYMAIKTDISKAYDRLEWDFLRDTMSHMGFDPVWISWIMKCVESVSFSVLVNGSPQGWIQPKRGIRQGDPLSPYLFILCSEVLSHLLTKAVSVNNLKGMKISTTGPTVNHLLFADDALFFCHAHPRSCRSIMKVLTDYEKVSGQAVNLHKSAITFGSRVQDHVKTQLRRILNIHNDGGCGKYLGLPEQVGRKKKEIFEFIKNKVHQRTQGWANRFLSEAGKEILIKTVALALPVYTMNCFKLPIGICDDINKLLASFWWKKDPHRRPMHWLAWKRMALPKSEGGLGFRDIESFNIAMLGKQVWRIMHSPNSLVAKVLKGRYFHSTSLLNAGLGTRPSFIWRSILEGRDLIKKGVSVLIGDGKDTNIWTDSWLPTHPPRPPRCIDGLVPTVSHVHQLMRNGLKAWDTRILESTIIPEDVAIIQRIRLTNFDAPDLLGWHYTESGCYTVKSGYWLQTHFPGQVQDFNPPPGSLDLKTAIWKLKTAPKIKHFCWRMVTNTLSVGATLKQRHIILDAQCKRCCAADETLDHLFFGCPYAEALWRGSNVALLAYFDVALSFEDKLRALLAWHRDGSRDSFNRQLPLWILWRLWKSRNILVHQRRSDQWINDLNHAMLDASEWAGVLYDSVNVSNQFAGPRINCRWTRPNLPFVKCNYDCRYTNQGLDVRAAWIIRNYDGVFLEGAKSIGLECSSVLEAELQSLLMAMQHTWSRGYKHAIFEGDNISIPKLLEGKSKHFGLQNLIREINFWKTKFEAVVFSWVPRLCNQVPHYLARDRFPPNCVFVSHRFVPSCITQFLHEDYCNSS